MGQSVIHMMVQSWLVHTCKGQPLLFSELSTKFSLPAVSVCCSSCCSPVTLNPWTVSISTPPSILYVVSVAKFLVKSNSDISIRSSVLLKVIIHTESELNLFAIKERSQPHNLRHKANRKGKLKLRRTCHICTLVFYWCLFFPLFSSLKQLLSHDTSDDNMTLCCPMISGGHFSSSMRNVLYLNDQMALLHSEK